MPMSSPSIAGAWNALRRGVPQGMARILDREALAWIVLVVSVLLTVSLWRQSEAGIAQAENLHFLSSAEEHKGRLIARMQAYEQVLRGGAALFSAYAMPTRAEWRDYVQRLELERSLPGILGTGFAIMVPAAEKATHERGVRAEGFSGYRIQPPGERPIYSSILYLEPFSARNLRAFGYDMYSDPIRREAMEQARDTGKPALSGRVTLVQETETDVQPGFLMYFPVYRGHAVPPTVAARRAALLGFVYSPFRAHDLLGYVFQDPAREVEVALYDGAPVADNLLYASEDGTREAKHSTYTTVDVAGRTWTARFRSSPAFEAGAHNMQPELVLFGGLALDFLLFSVLLLNARYRRKMRRAANELRESLDTFRSLVENIPGAVFRSRLGAYPPVTQLSPGIRDLTGEPPARFLSGEVSYHALIHPDDRAKVSEAVSMAIEQRGAYNVEYRIRAADGHTRWVSERTCVTTDAWGEPRWLDGVILDVTERKAAEIMIRDMAFNDTLTGLPNRRLLLDRLERQLATSERNGQYGAVLFIDMDNFKAINDTLGHEAGDQVLVEVAHRLLSSVRESDTVARLGGDEFVVLLDNLGMLADAAVVEAEELGTKILTRLSQPYQLGKAVRFSTPSIGIATFCGRSESAEQLLRYADQAMYRAKSRGRSRLQFYEGWCNSGSFGPK